MRHASFFSGATICVLMMQLILFNFLDTGQCITQLIAARYSIAVGVIVAVDIMAIRLTAKVCK